MINSNVFSNSKYSPDTILVTGSVTSVIRGTPITLHITKPDNTFEEIGILVTKDGSFSTPVALTDKWPIGNYYVTAIYGQNKIGTVYFQVVSDKTKIDTQPTQSDLGTQYLSYVDKQFGFSLNYPSFLEKNEILGKDEFYSNIIHLVSFTTYSELTFTNVDIIYEDIVYRGLVGQAFLDKMKTEFENNMCRFVESDQRCSLEVIFNEGFTHPNSYPGYRAAYLLTISYGADSMKALIGATMIPDGNDVWMIISGSFSGDEIKSLGKEIDQITNSFIISDYTEDQKQILQLKAVQQNDIVYLVIRNPDDSLDDIHSIKLTHTNGNITNFIKVKGWEYERAGPDSVIYKTITSPLSSSDTFKVALKLDGKNKQLEWEVFSDDQKSLGTGTLKL